MTQTDITTDPEAWVRNHHDRLLRVLRHSDDVQARAWAWTLLDEYGSDPDIQTLENELQDLKRQRGMNA